MAAALGKMTEVSKAGDKTRRSVDKIGRSLEETGKTLTAAVTVPIVGMGAVSYKTFESVDKQLKLVQATMGESAYATADLSGALQSAAVNSIFSMEEGASALVNYARQGFNAAEAADMLAPALNLAAGTATDLDSVTSGLGNTMKAFGASSEEAAKYADMFTQAQAQANTDVQGLFDSMSVAGPVAKTVGWEFADVATLIGVFGDQSIGATEGATALKTGLARLAAPAKQGAAAMEELGINIFEADGSMKSMPEVIGELQRGFDGLSEQESLAAASAIFGKNQMSNWLALINGPGISGLQEMRDNISGAAGNAQSAADAMVTPLEKLSSTFDVFKYSVGEAISGAVVPFIEKATELVDKFRQMSPEQQQQIIKWAAMAAAVGPALMAFGKMIHIAVKLFGAFGKLQGVIKAVTTAGGPLKALLAGLATPLGVVIAAIAAVAVVVAVVITHLDQFKAVGQQVMAVVGPAIQRLGQAFSRLGSVAMPIITLIGDMLADFLCGAFATLGVVAGAIIDGIALVINGLADAVSFVVSFINAIATGGWAGAWELIKSVAQPIIENFRGVIDGISQAVQGVVDFINAIVHGDWEGAWSALGSVASGIINAWKAGIDGLKSALDGVIGKVKEAKQALENMGSGPSVGGLHGVGVNASGTPNWRGGWTTVGEKGPELMNLPRGTQIIPHEASLNTPIGGGISIAKLADQIVVREDADIDRIGDAVVRKLRMAASMRGGYSFSGDMA
jgi:TP901 family phage tail tape measure protein